MNLRKLVQRVKNSGALARTIGFLIFGLVLCSSLFFIRTPPAEWLEEIGLNVGTEIIGILLVFFLIEMVIKKYKETERKNLEKIALKSIQRAVYRHIATFKLFILITKLPISLENSHLADNYELTKTFFDKMIPILEKNLPLSKTESEKICQSLDVEALFSQSCRDLSENLNRTIDKYAFSLNVELISLIEKIIDTEFMRNSIAYSYVIAGLSKLGEQNKWSMLTYSHLPRDINEHTKLLLQLLKYCGEI